MSILSKLSNFHRSEKILCNILFDCRKGHVIELVALKPNESNLKPFNYTNDFESIANSDNAIVRLIKSASSRSEKRYQEHRPESFKTNISSGKINNSF